MLIHLIRHAHAGHRRDWAGDDRERPLSRRGERQAAAIDRSLATAGIDRLLSSSYVRCVQTLGPLSRRTGVDVRAEVALTEGGSGAEALDLLLGAAASGGCVAACSHGDVIPAILATALGRGADLVGPAAPSKAARYELHLDRGQVTRIVHVAAPDGRS